MRRTTSPGLAVVLSLLLLISSDISAFAGINFVPGQGVVLTGADGVVLTGVDGVVLTGADGVVLTAAEGVVLTGSDAVGLQGLDPELAVVLNLLPDSSAVNVVVVFHQMPADADLD